MMVQSRQHRANNRARARRSRLLRRASTFPYRHFPNLSDKPCLHCL